MAANDSLVPVCREMGYHIEYVVNFDGTEDHSTVVVEFPCSSGDNSICAAEMTAVSQMELVKKLQTKWADNSVSVTVYYKEDELSEIQDWMRENYENSCKTLSFLMHSNHGFKQAPYEEISQEKFEKLSKGIKIEEGINVVGGNLDGVECEGGACPIK